MTSSRMTKSFRFGASAARIEANRQVRYLSTGVNPIPPDEPTYPRALEDTLLTFFVFAGLYLMISLTVSSASRRSRPCSR